MPNLSLHFGVRRRFRAWWDGHFGPLPRPDKWVFLVGCYNSGTTLLHDLLATHPDIGSMPGEGQFYTNELLLPQSVGLTRLWAIDEDRFRMDESFTLRVNLEKLKRQWGARYNYPDLPVLIEKSPTNAGRTRWLQKHFENPHFIGIVRNGYAVAEGINRKVGYSLEKAAQQWARSNEIMLDDFQRLHHKLLIRYEDLTENLEETLQKIFEFIGLDRVPVADQSWQIHEQNAPIQNMNARSFERLNEDQLQAIERVAGDMLVCLNYVRKEEV